jgi:hypothetical protein
MCDLRVGGCSQLRELSCHVTDTSILTSCDLWRDSLHETEGCGPAQVGIYSPRCVAAWLGCSRSEDGILPQRPWAATQV